MRAQRFAALFSFGCFVLGALISLVASDGRALDWWDYWINIHIPALRRWTYPLIEGRPLEARSPRNLLPLNNEDSETVKTGTNGATWRYS